MLSEDPTQRRWASLSKHRLSGVLIPLCASVSRIIKKCPSLLTICIVFVLSSQTRMCDSVWVQKLGTLWRTSVGETKSSTAVCHHYTTSVGHDNILIGVFSDKERNCEQCVSCDRMLNGLGKVTYTVVPDNLGWIWIAPIHPNQQIPSRLREVYTMGILFWWITHRMSVPH